MLEIASWSWALLWVAFAAAHLVTALAFRRWLRGRLASRSGASEPSRRTPPVSVFVAARGVDPSLVAMLRGVMAQDYPAYEVILVADGLGAWNPEWLPEYPHQESVEAQGTSSVGTAPALLRLSAARTGAPTLSVLGQFERLPACGLKCSALLAGIGQSAPNSKVFAFLDADIVPGPDWLRKLVDAASEPACGVATGAIWFDPPDARLGTVIRSLFNSAALFPAAIFNNPWAGSMALRKEVFEQTGLARIWAISVVDDGPVRAAVEKAGLTCRFVPSLIMANRESCSFAFSRNWLGRMMKWASIYDPAFWQTWLHALASTLFHLLWLAGLAIAISGSQWNDLVILVSGWILGNGLLVAGWEVMRRAARASMQGSAGLAQKSAVGIGWYGAALFAMPWTLAVFSGSTFLARFRKRIRWRGIDYHVERDGRTRWSEAAWNPSARPADRQESL